MAGRGVLLLLLAAGTYDGAWLAEARDEDQCGNATALDARVDALLAQYRREERPEGAGNIGAEGGAGGPLVVRVALNVRHASVDEPASSVRLIADLTLSWRDSRLQWNASEWGCSSVLVEAERLWLPDIELVSAGGRGGAGGALRARLGRAGGVSWARRLALSVPVPLDLTHWPRDTQTAVFKFASREYTAEELELAIMDMKYATVFEAGGWEAAALTAGKVTSGAEDDGAGSHRPVAGWALSLRRRAAGPVLSAAAVLSVAALLLLAAALQPPARRAPLAATASLVASIWLVSVSNVLTGSGRAPRPVAAAGGAALLGGLAPLAAALVLRLARRDRPPPHRLRALLAGIASVCSLTIDEPGDSGGGGGTWRALAALLDRALLAAGALTLVVLYGMCL